MKHHVINKDKIYEAYVNEPYEADSDLPFSGTSHGWQIVLVLGYSNDGYQNKTVIDKNNEEECIDFIKSLNFLNVS